MATFEVDLPITGYLTVEVNAEDEEAAIEAALQADFSIDDVVEWDACETIVTGNIFHGIRNDAEVREV